MDIKLLGQFDLRLDGAPVEILSRPAQSLLAYLVLNAGAAHRREKLAELLWPDASEANAGRNLRQALWQIRKALAPAGRNYLLADDPTVAFDAQADHTLDAARLDEKVADDAPVEALISVVSVYAGELLPGFCEQWAALQRERLQAHFERRMALLLEPLVEALIGRRRRPGRCVRCGRQAPVTALR